MVKFSKANFFKRIPRQAIFFVLAFLMLAVVSVLFIYSFIFLVANFNKALNQRAEERSIQGFDIEGFEKLNLIKK